jgi:hypothetical protein
MQPLRWGIWDLPDVRKMRTDLSCPIRRLAYGPTGTYCKPHGGHAGIACAILFAHGSGSSRLSPRNTYIAGELRKAGMGPMLPGGDPAIRPLVFMAAPRAA